MARFSLLLAVGLLVLGLAASPGAEEKPAAPAADKSAGPGGPAGTWKVYLPFLRDDGDKPLWLVKLEKKDGAWSSTVLARRQGASSATLENLAVTPDRLRFTLKLSDIAVPCEIKLPKEAADRLRGVGKLGRNVTPLELERTHLTRLDPFEELQEALSKQALGQEAVKMALNLLADADPKKVKPVEVRAWAEKAVKSAELYGTAWQRDILLTVATILLEKEGFAPVALQYARRAERMLEPKDGPALHKRVLSVLAAALEKGGKEADAKEVTARIKKLDFSIKPKVFAGRKGKSNRVVLVEEFTCAQAPACAGADLAFAALAKTYQPSEVVLLQYHLPLPQPDPLTGPAMEPRFSFYENLRNIPIVLFSGGKPTAGGGSAEDAVDKYEQYRSLIEPMLETPARAELKLTATRNGDKVHVAVEVTKLAEPGDDVRLRVALVEDQVAYKGANDVTVHPNVVRAMLDPDAGAVLKEKTLKKTYDVDVNELRTKLKTYLDKIAEKRPFPDKERPLDLKKLRVIAFVQNDKSYEVLQAAQVEVQTGP